MGVMIIAGVSFPCGAGELGEVALHHGYQPVFLDHPHNVALADAGSFPVHYLLRIPEDMANRSGFLIPLLESWVSEGRNLPFGTDLRFDKDAASVSRSKLALSNTLAAAGLDSVSRFPVETVEAATRAASLCGYPVVLRTDTGYSGHGVLIANTEDELRACWADHCEEQVGADYAKMRSVMNAPRDRLLIEPWLPGDEWSIDCIVSSAGALPIRVCRKATVVFSGRPVTLGYWLTESADLWYEMRLAAERWIRALFTGGGLSFACFDIRRLPNRELVPLDFGVRLGGDGIPLLVRRACQHRNPYAAALDAALADDPSRIVRLQSGNAIVHAVTQKLGSFEGITLRQSGEVINSKPQGFRLKPGGRLGAVHRVGSVLTQFNSESEFLNMSYNQDVWINCLVD